MNKLFQFSLLLITLGIISCEKNNPTAGNAPRLELPSTVYDYRALPSNAKDVLAGFTDVILNGNSRLFFSDPKMANSAITNHGATLGRVLFYDKNLSINNVIACASCHKQEHGFADNKAGSEGFEGRVTTRNSTTICNAGMFNSMFWDSRAPSVKAMTLNPIQNHIEMGMEDLDFLVKKLSNVSYYPELFKNAFGTTEITKEKISDALAQFVCSLVSTESKTDLNNRISNNNQKTYTELEQLGQNVFNSSKTACNTCHSTANFTNFYYNSETLTFAGKANIGLDAIDKDNGFLKGAVRIPSLRNIGISAPYMHDGRFNTLEEVVEHYNSGIQNNPNLDRRFRNSNGTVRRMNLSDIEKAALVAFLKTLTDEKFITDKKFSNPFVH